MKNIIKRIIWILLLRFIYRISHRGFKSSWRSIADKRCEFSEYNLIYGRSNLVNTKLGRFTYVVDACIKNTIIGAFCSVGPNTKIGCFAGHPTNWISTHPVFYSTRLQSGISFSDVDYIDELKITKIGNDVWVGGESIILDGVEIGNGAIIAAGSVVVKNVAPYSMVGGVPAKLIRMRFDQETISNINNSNWWNWEESQLRKFSKNFRKSYIDKELIIEFLKINSK